MFDFIFSGFSIKKAVAIILLFPLIVMVFPLPFVMAYDLFVLFTDPRFECFNNPVNGEQRKAVSRQKELEASLTEAGTPFRRIWTERNGGASSARNVLDYGVDTGPWKDDVKQDHYGMTEKSRAEHPEAYQKLVEEQNIQNQHDEEEQNRQREEKERLNAEFLARKQALMRERSNRLQPVCTQQSGVSRDTRRLGVSQGSSVYSR